jgi:hypothetical protein
MRAIWIEPATHEVSVLEIEASPRNLRELLGALRRSVARLPNGDCLLASAKPIRSKQFAIGGSMPVTGAASHRGKDHPISRASTSQIGCRCY